MIVILTRMHLPVIPILRPVGVTDSIQIHNDETKGASS